ncbi:endocytosis signaling protein, partial [Nannochloropsis gaditana]
MHVDRNYKTDFDLYYKMNGDRIKTNAGNSDWQKEQEEEVATAHTHPLEQMHTQDVEEIEEDDGFEDLGRRDDEVKRRGNSVDDENLKLAGLAGKEPRLRKSREGKPRGPPNRGAPSPLPSTSSSICANPPSKGATRTTTHAPLGTKDPLLHTLLDDPEASSSNPPQSRDDIADFHHASSHSSSTSFLKKRRKQFEIPPHQVPGQAYHATIQKLKALYRGKVLELEEKYLFHRFGFEELTQQQLEAKAQVLLLGQYSTGKTTMIRYLLGREYLGLHVGPEPTTDRYVAIVHGDVDDVISGKVLTENPALPFKETERFAGLGGKFQASRCPAPILESLTLIDTP